jgi:hypothetical protein
LHRDEELEELNEDSGLLQRVQVEKVYYGFGLSAQVPPSDLVPLIPLTLGL